MSVDFGSRSSTEAFALLGCFAEYGGSLTFEDGTNRLSQNISNQLQTYTTLHNIKMNFLYVLYTRHLERFEC
jgi:hypothetical protein